MKRNDIASDNTTGGYRRRLFGVAEAMLCLLRSFKRPVEKKGQVSYIDRDASNSARDNLVFLCFDHHDQYDSRTSQSKGLTKEEVREYRAQLDRFVAQSLPLSDIELARTLLTAHDRTAFRTPFQQESSLPRFRSAISETISTINTGKT
jgi:hypothetical protein